MHLGPVDHSQAQEILLGPNLTILDQSGHLWAVCSFGSCQQDLGPV